MVNVLVVDDNFDYAKNLINLISSQNSKMRLSNICTNGKEVMDIINNPKNKINIILLDLKLPNYNGIEILKYMEKNNFKQYQDSVIAISGENKFLSEIINNKYIHTFINKISGFELILKEVNKLIEIKDKEKEKIEYIIHKELEKLNFNFSYVGTQYLFEAIVILHKRYSDCYETQKLETNIYPIIAKKYKKTVNNIKTNIINATDIMYYDCNYKVLNQYFGLIDTEKPTPKVIITKILNNCKKVN